MKPHLIIKGGLVRGFCDGTTARDWARNVPASALEDFARMNRGLVGLAPRTFREWRNEQIKIAAFVAESAHILKGA